MKKEFIHYQIHYAFIEGNISQIGFFSSTNFSSIQDARDQQNKDKTLKTGDSGYDKYWKDVPSRIEKVTTIIEVVE